ncbi:MAG: hypothetical protein ABFC80_02005 [Coriobacteriales bacterium]
MADEKTTSEDLGLIEKAFLMGVGAALLAKDKAQELADELVKRGKLTREQTDSFVSRMVSRADEASKSVQTSVAKETEKVVETMGLASAKDVEEIREELTEIKSLIASLRPVDASPESK